MSGISNIPRNASERIQDLEYLYASIVNLSNFVSVKLSSDRNYHLWKTQMLCLMDSHNMAGMMINMQVREIQARISCANMIVFSKVGFSVQQARMYLVLLLILLPPKMFGTN
ncbi:hypothetical protein Tco_1307724 [Tanacetum coccineum]